MPKISPRLQNKLCTALMLGLLGGVAYVSARYPVAIDVTQNAANSLSPVTQSVLYSLPDKVTLTAYIRQGQPLRTQIAHLVDRYTQQKPNLTLSFVDPDLAPEKARELNIGPEGVIVVDYQGRTEKLSFMDEAALTNALLQLADNKGHWLSFLTGHGERSPDTLANFDVSDFAKELARRNIRAQSLNLAKVPAIPDNSAVLVIASPSVPLLAGEMSLIKDYVAKGGHLLLLTDPDNSSLHSLLHHLGVTQLPGSVLDDNAKLYGVDDASFVLASVYPAHPITQGLKTMALFPGAAAFNFTETGGFKFAQVLQSSALATLSTSAQAGVKTYAVALTQNRPDHSEQRIVVVGDGDFLANAYLGNVGNLDLGLRMIAWLAHDDRYIDIPAKPTHDKRLQFSQMTVAMMGFGFLLVLPITLLGTGLVIWWRRKRR